MSAAPRGDRPARERNRLLAAHSVLGVSLALALFIVSFTGTTALFVPELAQWEHPTHRLGPPPAGMRIDPLVRSHLDAWPHGPGDVTYVSMPTPLRPIVELHHHADGTEQHVQIDPTTGRELPFAGESLSRFLREIHTDLYLPPPWGRYLVRLLGFLMMLSLATGTILHKRFFRDLRTFRPDRSQRLLWKDTHTVIGSWGLPFHLTLAFTGTVLGLSGVFLRANAVVSYEGDIEAVLGATPTPAGRAAAMSDLDALVDDARHRRGDVVSSLEIHHRGDADGRLAVVTTTGENLNPGTEHHYAIADGSHLSTRSIGDSAGGRAYAAVTPLHYGTFGGIPLKLLYAVIGAASSVLVLTGLQVLLERAPSRAVAPRGLEPLRRLTTGVAGGLPVATLAAFHACQWLPDDGDRKGEIAVAFFATWAACIGVAALRTAGAGTLLLRAAAGAALTLPLVNGWRTGDGLLETIAAGRWAIAGIDLGLLALGCVAWLVAGSFSAASTAASSGPG